MFENTRNETREVNRLNTRLNTIDFEIFVSNCAGYTNARILLYSNPCAHKLMAKPWRLP